ncbi:hypothetical protein AB0E62_21260 [Streptomyces sp. NPDC038707]|uniref:hypothetical protein n=1 Tax=Streptomyces sp. NPDC038707 TaxID=3154329 RepID=UPI0033D6BC82
MALARRLGRPGNVVPIVSATRPERLADNLAAPTGSGSTRTRARLDEVSAAPLGFPHDFLREAPITRTVYGDRWPEIVHRRSTYRRTVRDVL